MDDEKNLEQERSQPRGEALQSLLSAELQRRRSQYRPLGRPRPKRYNGRVMVMLVLAASVAVFPGVFLLAGSSCWGSGSRQSNQSGRPSVALVDQLAIETPNPGFVQSVNSSASAAGYRFDYYPPKTATVDFFVQFPRLGYSIIILRTHGAGLVSTDPTVIATSDEYSQSSRVTDQLLNRLTTVSVNGTRFFALTPDFIKSSMCGRFPGTLVLTMYCEGAQQVLLAKAFIDKGAGAYVGWNGLVTVSHTDLVFETLVKALLDGNTVASSVQSVTAALGADPVYGSQLRYYPTAQGGWSS